MEFDHISCEACLSPIEYTHILRFCNWLTTGPPESQCYPSTFCLCTAAEPLNKLSLDCNQISCDICPLPIENNHMLILSIWLTTDPLVSWALFAFILCIAATLLNRFRPNFIWSLFITYKIHTCLNVWVDWQLVTRSHGCYLFTLFAHSCLTPE
jgi:hypothetical protein